MSPLLSVLPARVQRRVRSLLHVVGLVAGLVAALGVVVWAFAADGGSLTRQVLTGGGLSGVPWEALLVLAVGCVVLRWGRSAQLRTVVDVDAVAVGFGRRERRVGWDEVSTVEPAQRSGTWPTAVLTDGTRLALPGVPPEVAAGLAEVLAAASQQPPAASRDGDRGGDGADGPLRSGVSGG